MDYQIVWTLRSRQDLRNIASFIAKDNPSAALKLGDLIFARVDMLEKFPEIGRIVLERNQPHSREIVVRPYRIVYRLRKPENLVEILRVWHGARGEPSETPLPVRRARRIRCPRDQRPRRFKSQSQRTDTKVGCGWRFLWMTSTRPIF